MAPIAVPLQRTLLKNLNKDIDNVLVVGIIVGKQRPKKFLDKKAPVETYKGVWNFTIRDSVQDYVNVSYWGPAEVILQANERFHSGHVVELINPRISVRSLNDFGEQFRPMVTSPFSLSLTEKSSLVPHAGPWDEYLKLLKLPTKPLAGFLPLRDVHNSGAMIQETFVDVLVAVKGLGQTKTITTKYNDVMQVRTVDVFDHTSTGVKVEIWEPDVITRSEKWKPRLTALFITDLKIQWSPFFRQFVLKFTQRTIVTENPEGKDVDKLLNYASTAPIETFEIVDQLMTNLPDATSIRDVMSVKQVQDKVNVYLEENRLGGTKQFTALVYAFVSSLDLDGLSKTLLIKCGRCRAEMKGSACANGECSTSFDNGNSEPDVSFDIRITLTDHTGTLVNCRFRGQVVEEALGCEAKEFANMSDDQKEMLKWKYLMERCAVKLAVDFVGNRKPVVSVVHIARANIFEVASKLPVY